MHQHKDVADAPDQHDSSPTEPQLDQVLGMREEYREISRWLGATETPGDAPEEA